jgi:hypothetical protein
MIVGGTGLLEVRNTSSAAVAGNKVFGNSVNATYTVIDSGTSYTWNNNTYYGSQNQTPFGCPGLGLCQFSTWRSRTGYDSSSIETASAMPDAVFVRANNYQPGRANIFIYAPSSPASINVNLSSAGLTNGQGYTIKNAFNYFGASVYSGTYNSASPTINLPLTGASQSVAMPIGHGYTPSTTCPQFCAMVVVPN